MAKTKLSGKELGSIDLNPSLGIGARENVMKQFSPSQVLDPNGQDITHLVQSKRGLDIDWDLINRERKERGN